MREVGGSGGGLSARCGRKMHKLAMFTQGSSGHGWGQSGEGGMDRRGDQLPGARSRRQEDQGLLWHILPPEAGQGESALCGGCRPQTTPASSISVAVGSGTAKGRGQVPEGACVSCRQPAVLLSQWPRRHLPSPSRCPAPVLPSSAPLPLALSRLSSLCVSSSRAQRACADPRVLAVVKEPRQAPCPAPPAPRALRAP